METFLSTSESEFLEKTSSSNSSHLIFFWIIWQGGLNPTELTQRNPVFSVQPKQMELQLCGRIGIVFFYLVLFFVLLELY